MRALGFASLLPTIVLVVVPLGLTAAPSAHWPGVAPRAAAVLSLTFDPVLLAVFDCILVVTVLSVLLARGPRAGHSELPSTSAELGLACLFSLGVPLAANAGLSDLRVRVVLALLTASLGVTAVRFATREPRFWAISTGALVVGAGLGVAWFGRSSADLLVPAGVAMLVSAVAALAWKPRPRTPGLGSAASLVAMLILAVPQGGGIWVAVAVALPFLGALILNRLGRRIPWDLPGAVAASGWTAAAAVFCLLGLTLLAAAHSPTSRVATEVLGTLSSDGNPVLLVFVAAFWVLLGARVLVRHRAD